MTQDKIGKEAWEAIEGKSGSEQKPKINFAFPCI